MEIVLLKGFKNSHEFVFQYGSTSLKCHGNTFFPNYPSLNVAHRGQVIGSLLLKIASSCSDRRKD